jgi:hypothetical protein
MYNDRILRHFRYSYRPNKVVPMDGQKFIQVIRDLGTNRIFDGTALHFSGNSIINLRSQ